MWIVHFQTSSRQFPDSYFSWFSWQWQKNNKKNYSSAWLLQWNSYSNCCCFCEIVTEIAFVFKQHNLEPGKIIVENYYNTASSAMWLLVGISSFATGKWRASNVFCWNFYISGTCLKNKLFLKSYWRTKTTYYNSWDYCRPEGRPVLPMSWIGLHISWFKKKKTTNKQKKKKITIELIYQRVTLYNLHICVLRVIWKNIYMH